MKIILFIIILVFGSITSGLAEDTTNPQLRDELLQMEMGDQEIRERLKPLFINPDVRDTTCEPLIKRMATIFDGSKK